jgi:hypothetical protein
MYRKHLPVLAAAAAALVLAAPALATSSPTASLVIQHVKVGCHSWSLNGGKLLVDQSVSLARGGSLAVTDNDVMPHTLIQLSGSKVVIAPRAKLSHMGARLTVTFTRPGVYRFATKAGEDYMAGVKTVGTDHVLKLTVTVK